MKTFFIIVATLFLKSSLFAQQLQMRDSNAVDLDSIDIDNYSEHAELLVDEPPIFKGKHSDFNAYIKKHLIYPTEAQSKFIEGTVYVSYIIDIDGKVKNVRIMQSSNPTLDQAALDVVAHSPKWKPATFKGKPVSY